MSSWAVDPYLGLVLLTLVEFPDAFFLSLVDDGKNTGGKQVQSWRAWKPHHLLLWWCAAGTAPTLGLLVA